MTRTSSQSRGFTLLELVAVLIILGIILGIAVLTWNPFLDQVSGNRVDAVLDRVTTIEQPIARDWGSYTAWPADLSDAGTDITILNGRPSSSPTQVSVVVGSKGTMALAVRKAKGVCVFRLVAPLNAGGGTTVPTGIPAAATCTGQSALTAAEDPLTQTASIKVASN